MNVIQFRNALYNLGYVQGLQQKFSKQNKQRKSCIFHFDNYVTNKQTH